MIEPTRLERAAEGLARLARAAWRRAVDLARNPARVLVGAVCAVLVIVAASLLAGGAMRLDRARRDWRHDTTVDRHWVATTATVRAVRLDEGLTVDLAYSDRDGDRHQPRVHVDSTGSRWLRSPVPIRYDPRQPDHVDLVGVAEAKPLGSALIAGAAVGAGLAALVLATATWRRRRVLAVSAHPLAVLRTPLTVSGVLLALGIGAWAVGTVSLQGWASIADRIGVQLSKVFGDLIGVTIPIVTFALGCLLTAWLARHRHHERHEGLLSSAHRIIDRASEYMPSPEQLTSREETDAREPGEPPHAA